jgi:hypothetical protein
MKMAWHLFIAFGGFSVAYHAWMLIPETELGWRVLATGTCVVATINQFVNDVRA